MWLFFILFTIGLVVALHELGHFIVAKMFKIEIERFMVGIPLPFKLFGKKVLTIEFTHRNVLYQFSPLLLGGAVVFREDDHTGKNFITNVRPWKRVLVSLAGPLANILSCFFTIFLMNVLPPMTEQAKIARPYQLRTPIPSFTVEENGKKTTVISPIPVDEKIIITFPSAIVTNKNTYQFKHANSYIQQLIAAEPKVSTLTVFTNSVIHTYYFTKMATVKTIEAISPSGLKEISSIVGVVGIGKNLDDKLQQNEKKNDKKFVMAFFMFYFFLLFPIFHLSIGIFNLMPIPPFDGGSILGNIFQQLCFWFKINLNANWFEQLRFISQRLGFVFILCLMVIAFKNDISNFWVERFQKTNSQSSKEGQP